MQATEENAIRSSLERNETTIGVRAKTHSPLLIETYGAMGFDFVWVDFEHGGTSPHDSHQLEALARTCETAGIEPLVRLPDGNPPLVRKALDAGLHTILIPRVETADEARRAISASRFTYDGGAGARGFAGVRTNLYGDEMENYDERADSQTLVGVQIESERSVTNLEEILSVPALGFVFIGYGDLAISLGHPLDPEHAEVQRTISKIRDACKEANIPVGYTVSDTTAALDAIEAGYRLVRVGDEVSAVRENLGERLEVLREAP